ncbi:MAG: ATP-grasp domain-containing protein [Leptospiraceae bacterium]|nr:ATP-grasp domain-containing protein [Leptospiraceae bacterium]MCP5493761.1 ATP-grasp domain-containing protein [Leptospiraceae bacterium]
MKNPVIAVTGLNAVDSPGPGVPVLRSLKESSIEPTLIGLAYDVLEPGNFMPNLVESTYIIPYPNSGPDSLLERIKYIHEKKKLDVILPTLDSELDNYIQIQTELEKIGIKMLLPGKDQLHMRDKSILRESLENQDILLPETYTIQEASALKQITEKLSFPIFIKGLLYEAYIARNIEEAVGYFYHISAKWGIPVIVQECINGEECNVAAFSIGGNVISAVVMKKMFLTDKGKAWAGVTIDNPKTLHLAQKILNYVKWDGGCELEFIVEQKTNKIYLLEMNPRFPAWIYLATSAGQNMPEYLVRTILGETIQPVTKYDIGKIFVRHSWDDIVSMKSIESLSTKGELEYATV